MAIPFSIQYLTNRVLSPDKVDYSSGLAAFKSTSYGMFAIQNVSIGLLKTLTVTLLLPLASIGAIILWKIFAKKQEVKWLSFLLLGVCLVGVGIPVIEPLIDSKMHLLPILLEMNRNLRYMVPLLEVLVIFPLAELSQRISITTIGSLVKKCVPAVTGLFIVTVLIFRYVAVTKSEHHIAKYIGSELSCLAHRKVLCPNHSLDA